MKFQVHITGEQNLHYNIKNGKKQDTFDILHDISDFFTLLQLMDIVGNVKKAVSIVEYWIFESNYQNELPLKIYSSNLLCSISVGEGLFSMFETVFMQSNTSATEEKYRALDSV